MLPFSSSEASPTLSSMRLINIDTLQLEEYADPPPYAILSHRWTGDEITYEKYMDREQRHGPGYEKIRDFCAFLREYFQLPKTQITSFSPRPVHSRIRHAWVDTCCIDKRSSAELSEAINSMWQFYENAAFCIVYLVDVTYDVHWSESFIISAWFQRGWTLQELLAPSENYFCDIQWRVIGQKTKASMNDLLASATGIPGHYFFDDWDRYNTPIMAQRKSLNKYDTASVAQKMSWASERMTTRPEDMAYCLFGLFGVNLPLLYGEGNRAFGRLQEEIARRSEDESIFAWKLLDEHLYPLTGLFAPSPTCFSTAGNIKSSSLVKRFPYEVTKNGIKIQSRLLQTGHNNYLLRLNCAEYRDGLARPVRPDLESPRHKKAFECTILLSLAPDKRFIRNHQPEPYESLSRNRHIEETVLYIHEEFDFPMRPGRDLGKIKELGVTGQACLLSTPHMAEWYSEILDRQIEPGTYTLDGRKIDSEAQEVEEVELVKETRTLDTS